MNQAKRIARKLDLSRQGYYPYPSGKYTTIRDYRNPREMYRDEKGRSYNPPCMSWRRPFTRKPIGSAYRALAHTFTLIPKGGLDV